MGGAGIGSGIGTALGAGLGTLIAPGVGTLIGAGLGGSVGGGIGGLLDQPSIPGMPKGPSPADEAVRNARVMERRKQLGLQGRMSTFLTTAQGDQAPSQASAPAATLLGG